MRHSRVDRPVIGNHRIGFGSRLYPKVECVVTQSASIFEPPLYENSEIPASAVDLISAFSQISKGFVVRLEE